MKSENILLQHGSGGSLTGDLIRNIFYKYFSNDYLLTAADAALLSIQSEEMLAFTTDSYVVDPLIFPGGDIGKLAVCGTCNDLAVSGAMPRYLSAGFIIEEGISFELLEQIVRSMADEAKKAGVMIVTGDTKVVPKGKGDKIFINTSGIGFIKSKFKNISTGEKIQSGDKIIITGPIACHGTAILCARNELQISTEVKSDCAFLHNMIHTVLSAVDGISFMRDATRGGVATVLGEIVKNKNYGVRLEEDIIPVLDAVRGLCEMLGFDPLYMANEGCAVIITDNSQAEQVLSILKDFPQGKDAAVIGEITDQNPGAVIMQTAIGGRRVVDILPGDQLPRIC